MGFERREGLVGGEITKYADKNMPVCPFCKSNHPHWLTEAYIANYSLISAKCLNGYKFQCEQCGGVFEIQGHTDFCFQTEAFTTIKLLDAGNGSFNKDKIGIAITIDQLKQLCSGEYSGEEVIIEETYKKTEEVQEIKVVPIQKSQVSKFNIFALLSLIFSNIALLFSEMEFFFGDYDEDMLAACFLMTFLFGIPAFVFQFIARSKKSIVLWKIFSWISFGTCILALFISIMGMSLMY